MVSGLDVNGAHVGGVHIAWLGCKRRRRIGATREPRCPGRASHREHGGGASMRWSAPGSGGLPAVLALLSLIAAPPGAAQTPSGEPIKIGAVLSLTGPGAGLGQAERSGVQLAEKLINDKGGI